MNTLLEDDTEWGEEARIEIEEAEMEGNKNCQA